MREGAVKRLIPFFVVLALAAVSCTRSEALTEINVDDNGLAIKGYDPVAYFTRAAAIKGSPEHSFRWKGAEWRFSSAEHLELFREDPEKYSPQYGGYWAWAVSRGYTADIDPEAWSIADGKLYLNFSRKVRETWSRDVPGNVEKADANWPGVLPAGKNR